MFAGFSIRTAILMRRSSGKFLTFCSVCHSGVRLLLGVGWMTTLPSSLSSRLHTPELSVYSLTFTLGSGCVVVKSPCVSQLKGQTFSDYSTINLHSLLKLPLLEVNIYEWYYNTTNNSAFLKSFLYCIEGSICLHRHIVSVPYTYKPHFLGQHLQILKVYQTAIYFLNDFPENISVC